MVKRIIVVEDDLHSMQALTKMLEHAGHEVEAFETGEAVHDRGPALADAAIIDVHLPGMSGTALAKELKQDNPGMNVMLMTGFAVNDEDLICGVTLFKKPLNMDRLLRLLDRPTRESWSS